MDHSHSFPREFLRTREFYDGLSLVITNRLGATEYIEYVLRDLAPGDAGETRVRMAVLSAHKALGVSQ